MVIGLLGWGYMRYDTVSRQHAAEAQYSVEGVSRFGFDGARTETAVRQSE